MNTYTIGFTRKSAETFFGLLRTSGISTLIDVRLHNTSQLAGFAKREDLKYFLRELCGSSYLHLPDLAPTADMLGAYRQGRISWQEYEDAFKNLLACRSIERQFSADIFEGACLLCSEHEPHHCHRRLVVDYLNAQWGSILKVEHLY